MRTIEKNIDYTNPFISILKKIIKTSLNELMNVRNEREVQDLLRYRLMGHGISTKTRVTLTSEEFPNVEVDLLCENKIGIEVKLDAKFYDGFAQALSMREFYGLNPIIIHVFRKQINPKIIRGIFRLSKLLNIPTIIVDAKNKRLVI